MVFKKEWGWQMEKLMIDGRKAIIPQLMKIDREKTLPFAAICYLEKGHHLRKFFKERVEEIRKACIEKSLSKLDPEARARQELVTLFYIPSITEEKKSRIRGGIKKRVQEGLQTRSYFSSSLQ